MANEKIVEYLKKCLKAGFLKEQIWVALEKAGWKRAQIDEAFGLVKKKKPTPKKFLPILLIVVALAGCATLAFFYWQMRGKLLSETREVENLLKQIDTLENKIEELKTEEKAPTDETAAWKAYRNEEYGYEVKYPDNFQIDSSNPKNVFIGTNMVHRGPYGVLIRILDKGLAEEINALKTRDEITKVLEETKITIGGIEATKLVLTAAIGYNDFYYLFTNNNLTYELEGNASAGFEGQEYHEKILSTFKLIE